LLFIDKEMNMLNRDDRLVKTSRLVVRIALIVNRVFFVAVICLLLVSLIFHGQFAGWMLQPAAGRDLGAAATGMRLLMLIGIAMAVGTEILLRALLEIIASAGAGDPFISVNARRLRTIGWALLGLQCLEFPAFLLDKYFPSMGSAAPDVSISPGGWIAVLMVFVLSRVFAAGAAMKDDLEGTV
jgi:hypothetical protein